MKTKYLKSAAASVTDITQAAELYVQDLTMSKRLQNVLERNGIYELSMVTRYSYEKIMHFRNMGSKTYEELENLCNKYHVPLKAPTVTPPISDDFKETGLPLMFLTECVRNGFATLNDLNGIDTQTLFSLCNQNYILTQQIHHSLCKLGITFGTWEDSYLFEHLSVRYAMRLWECFHITTVSQLLSRDMKTISGARGIGRKGIKEIDSFRRTLSQAL